MSVRKDKIGILEEVVHEAGQFTHDGGKTDLFGFSVGSEALIKRGEDTVSVGGTHSGHVEDVTHLCATAANVARSRGFARVVGIRCDADQSGDSRGLNFAEFRHVGEDGGSEHGAHAGDFLQAL